MSKKQTAFITGDMGFIGRHFRMELERRGYDVIGCDIRGIHPDDPEYRGNDCRTYFTGPYALKQKFDLVIHAAAVIGGRTKIDGDPISTAENIELDELYLRWLTQARPKHAVYISSSAVYPTDIQNSGRVRLTESMQNTDAKRIGTPDQVYGWSKLVGEMLVRKVLEAGVLVTVIRPFSGYGSDQDLDYPFPSFIKRAVNREDPFTIWGNGNQSRDFIHVDDIVNGTLAMVEYDHNIWMTRSGAASRLHPFNLCTGVSTSFNNLARMISEEVNRHIDGSYKPELRHMTYAPTGVTYRTGDPDLMLDVYRPVITLRDGIRNAVADKMMINTPLGDLSE